ncbi:MAG: ATP-binding protein, partial [Chloroflexota bacterium]|nr:ATP-binding protein [Chloroflexota bacterium]
LDEMKMLSAVVADWAYWDTTYQFALRASPEIGSVAPLISLYEDYGINAILMTDTLGIPLLASMRDSTTGEIRSMSIQMSSPLAAIAYQLDFSPNPQSNVRGIVSVNGTPILIAARAVLDNHRARPIVGTLIFGKIIDTTYADMLSDQLLMSIQFYNYDAAELPTYIQDTMLSPDPAQTVVINPLSDTEMVGYMHIDGINGQPAMWMVVNYTRNISIQGRETIRLLAILLIAAGLIVSLVLLFLLETLVTRRVSSLSASLETIRADDTLTRRIKLSGDDELNQLGCEMNNLLNRLAEARGQLTDQNTALVLAYDKAREANRLKSQFLSTMSHELRTPLNSIIGYSYILTESMAGNIDNEARKMVGIVANSADHLLGLINTILDLSKIEAGRMEIVESDIDIRRTIDSVSAQIAVLASVKGLAFTIKVDANLPALLRGDERRLIQIVVNLLSNAVKFTEQGTVIYETAWRDNLLIICVTDTGIGIPSPALSYIFDEFRQVDGSTKRAYGGTGLGLSIARQLARAMGGEIDVESTVGVGSKFTVWLPLTPVQAPSGVAIRLSAVEAAAINAPTPGAGQA